MRRASVSRRFALRRLARRAGVLGAIAAAMWLAAQGGFHLVRRLPVFHVERVEVTGIEYLTRDGVRAAAGVDSTTSVWESTARMAARLRSHPMITAATVERALPSTLVVTVEEAVPVALTALPLVEPVDRSGNLLPVDPTAPMLDLPLLRTVSRHATVSWGMRILARDMAYLLELAPEVFAIVSEARLDDREATLMLGDEGLRVRYRPPISEQRVRDAVIALNDAHERFPERVTHEIDLRFADQVIVRTTAPPPQAEPAAHTKAGG